MPMEPGFVAFVTVLALSAPGPSSPPAELTAPPPVMPPLHCQAESAQFDQEAEALIAIRIEALRSKFAPGAPAIAPDPELTRIAQARACAIASGAQDFSHTDDKGVFIAGRLVHEHLGPHGTVGENIMEADGTMEFGAEAFAKAAVEGWMNSPGHRHNILNPRYSLSGVGVAKMGGQAVAAQIFFGLPVERDSDSH